MYSLGLDIGSSSIKVALVDLNGRNAATVVRMPDTEMSIQSPAPQWAEQDPDDWWHHAVEGIQKVIRLAGIQPKEIKSIGLAYQMHGLVIIDHDGKALRPAIIWCDSRAVESGKILSSKLNDDVIKSALFNQPGNFTASKLKWVIDHEPEIFAKTFKIMLPGDYIAFRMSGEVTSTYSGMSEGIFFDFNRHEISRDLLEAMGINEGIFPKLGGSFETLTSTHATFEKLTGIPTGTPISYRAGDQPNNAFSLGVLSEGEAAGTGGTSGVIYTVSRSVAYDAFNRVNTFAHVNHSKDLPSLGTLLCINGTGILYNWMRTQFFDELRYSDLEKLISQVQAEGITFLPFGNGAERMLGNQVLSAFVGGIDFNRHDKRHLLRAGIEGIAFAFAYGFEILDALGVKPAKMRVGNDNLFQSAVFSQTLADVAGVEIKVYETTGAIGAAKGAALGAGLAEELSTLNQDLTSIQSFYPVSNAYAKEAYLHWKEILNQQLSKQP